MAVLFVAAILAFAPRRVAVPTPLPPTAPSSEAFSELDIIVVDDNETNETSLEESVEPVLKGCPFWQQEKGSCCLLYIADVDQEACTTVQPNGMAMTLEFCESTKGGTFCHATQNETGSDNDASSLEGASTDDNLQQSSAPAPQPAPEAEMAIVKFDLKLDVGTADIEALTVDEAFMGALTDLCSDLLGADIEDCKVSIFAERRLRGNLRRLGTLVVAKFEAAMPVAKAQTATDALNKKSAQDVTLIMRNKLQIAGVSDKYQISVESIIEVQMQLIHSEPSTPAPPTSSPTLAQNATEQAVSNADVKKAIRAAEGKTVGRQPFLAVLISVLAGVAVVREL